MTDALKEKLAGRRVVASVSGGKDSTALSLWLHEQGIEHDRVFMDTGWEHPFTYEYLRGELPAKIGSIVWLSPRRKMVKLCLRKAMFPSRMRRWCTEELKTLPMKRHLAALMDDGIDVVNAVGIRREESKAREASLEWEWSRTFDCEVWRPLVEWTVEDVIEIHRRHDLRPNPMYYRLGATRVGCWPCIFARKDEIRRLADADPERIDLIRRLEGRVARRQAARLAERGTTLEAEGYGDPSWFQSPLRSESGGCWPIDRVVEWSRTSRGGRQLELFWEPDTGCMRWGLCDHG